MIDDLLAAIERNIAIRRFAAQAQATYQRLGDDAAKHGFADRAKQQAANAAQEAARLREIETEIATLCVQVVAEMGGVHV